MTPSDQPYEPRQQQLLPSALQDWLPEGHLAYYISDEWQHSWPHRRPKAVCTPADPLAHARNLGHPNTSPTLTPTLSRQRERGKFIRRDR
jgi:hypothetical protein